MNFWSSVALVSLVSGLVSLLKFLDLGKTLGIPTVGSYVTELPILFSKINRKSIATFFSFCAR